MNAQENMLETYQLSGNAQADVTAFFNEMLKLKLKVMSGEKTKRANGTMTAQDSIELRRTENQYNRSQGYISRKPITVEHVQIAIRLAADLTQKITETHSQRDDAISTLKELTEQEKQITLSYKDLVLTNNETAIQRAEQNAVDITAQKRRFEIRRDGYADAANRLAIDLEVYERIERACRRSLLRQKALVTINEYKKAVEVFAPVYQHTAAMLEVAGNLLSSEESLGTTMINHLKKAVNIPEGLYESNPEFDAIKRKIEQSVEDEINATA